MYLEPRIEGYPLILSNLPKAQLIRSVVCYLSEKSINMASKINLSPPVASVDVLSKAVVLLSLIHFLLLPLLIVGGGPCFVVQCIYTEPHFLRKISLNLIYFIHYAIHCNAIFSKNLTLINENFSGISSVKHSLSIIHNLIGRMSAITSKRYKNFGNTCLN